jgi:starvation-inducible DNA-binding protein
VNPYVHVHLLPHDPEDIRPRASIRDDGWTEITLGDIDTRLAVSSQNPAVFAAIEDAAEVVELISARIYAAVDTIRAVHDAVDAEDPSTSDLLHQIIDTFEKLAWMVKAENRKI